jgi:hypothetical protein
MECVVTQIEVTTPDDVSLVFQVTAGIPVPGPGLPEAPVNGTGYVRKDGNWVPEGGAALPAGGDTAQVLTKNSPANGDASWKHVDDGFF